MDSLPSQQYSRTAVPPQRSNPPLGWHGTQFAGFAWRKKDEKEFCPNGFSNIYFVLPPEIWKARSGVHSEKKTDPLGAGIALQSGSIHFDLKTLLLKLNIYIMTTRPHHESWRVVIISWLRAPKNQAPLTPGNACWEPWHAGTWWHCDEWLSDETQRCCDPPQQTVPPPLRGQNILHSQPLAMERCQHDVAKLQRDMYVTRFAFI